MPPSVIRSRPVIGVTAGRLEIGDRTVDLVHRDYSTAVARAGGLPHLLPPLPSLDPAETVANLDGLLLTGGGDVNPTRYGEVAVEETSGVDDERDQTELALVEEAVRQEVPILGICRGCQVLNVAFGGTLVQHLPKVTSQPHLILGPRTAIAHSVTVAPGTELSSVLGTPAIGVNSIHHQGIAIMAPVLRLAGWAEDGSPEAVERSEPPILAVQWHPENLLSHPGHLRLFEWLVGKAAHRRAKGLGDVDGLEATSNG
jgi:putative glutamine amidotransferase